MAIVTLNHAPLSQSRAKRPGRNTVIAPSPAANRRYSYSASLRWLEGRWREDADKLHSPQRTRVHAGMHAVVLRLSARKIRRHDCRPMLCRHHHAWQFGRGGKRAATSYALNRRAVVVMTAFFWIPVVCLGWRDPEDKS